MGTSPQHATENSFTYTSESVCAGHPDKVCDQISDAILDEALTQDPNSRVALETVVSQQFLGILGEVTTTAKLDYEKIARAEIKRLGFTNPELKFTDNVPVTLHVHHQSPEISQGVDTGGAGDQGLMIGYACNETPELMPLPIMLAHELCKAVDLARESELIKNLRPDGKSQVTVRYEGLKPVGIESLILAVPHDESLSQEKLKKELTTKVIEPVLGRRGYSLEASPIINAAGAWHFSGPAADTGLTGRKIVVDGYGGMARVGGGAFSGKDASKVDRSGAYMARFIAKNIVAQGLADRCEVRLAYVIGRAKPVMHEFDCFGTEKVPHEQIYTAVDALGDCGVGSIISQLDLKKPVFRETAAYGHFGWEGRSWEKIV